MHTLTVSVMPANENGRGNLAGYKVSCTCGNVETTTMQSEVQFMVRDHLQYWTPEREAAKARRQSGRKAAATRKRNADPFGYKAAAAEWMAAK